MLILLVVALVTRQRPLVTFHLVVEEAPSVLPSELLLLMVELLRECWLDSLVLYLVHMSLFRGSRRLSQPRLARLDPVGYLIPIRGSAAVAAPQRLFQRNAFL